MRITEQLRQFFQGADSSNPSSTKLHKALADLNARVVKNGLMISELEEQLPMAVIKSIDAGATERRKLAALQSEGTALAATIPVLEQALEEALVAENAAALEAAWEATVQPGEAYIAAVAKLQDAVDHVAELALAALALERQWNSLVPNGDYRTLSARLGSMISWRLREQSGHVLALLARGDTPLDWEISRYGYDDLLQTARGLVRMVTGGRPELKQSTQPVASESAALSSEV